MTLCFVDPADAIRAIADSVGREARRQLLGEAVRAWVDEIPDEELEDHYAKAISELDEHDISMLAAWHGSMEVGQPLPNRDFLMGAFDSLGEHRREALKLAAGFRGEEAFEEGISEERALDTVLEWLSQPRLMELAREATELYIWDRAAPTTSSARSRPSAARISVDRLLAARGSGPRHPQLAGGLDVRLDVVDEQALAGRRAAEALERELVDLGLRLAHADEGRVDDQLEDLVHRQHRAPQRLPLAHVVGQHRHPVARALSSRISSIIGSFGCSASK